MITELHADLFELSVDALAHGCNSQGVMGDGIAAVFKAKYPNMFLEYEAYCKAELFKPGEVHYYNSRTSRKPSVINLCTQLTKSSGARPEFIRKSFEAVLKNYKDWKVRSIAMPEIGCGLGGLNWNRDVKDIVYEVFGTSDLEVLVAHR